MDIFMCRFIAYKFPKIHDSANPYIRQGLGYAFVLPGQSDWQVSVGKGIDNPDSLVGWTLRPLFHEVITCTDLHNFCGCNLCILFNWVNYYCCQLI